MTTTFVFSFILGITSIGRAVPTEIRCTDLRTGHDVGAGSFLDAMESLAVVQLAESYERGCAEKTVALAEHRDELQSDAEIKAGLVGAGGGASFSLLALLRRKKKPDCSSSSGVAK